jgi:putative copper resistance protein D
VAPPAHKQADAGVRARIEARLLILFRVSLIAALATAILRLTIQSAFMADAGTLLDSITSVWPVLTDTRFGHVLALRVALLALSAIAMGRGSGGVRVAAAALAAGVALAPHAWLAHAGATPGAQGVILLGSETLHVLAAGAWVGSLSALFIAVGAIGPEPAAHAARRYSRFGALWVATLATTAFIQGWILIGGFPGLLGTNYGWFALLKLGLFLSMLAIATANRFLYTPALGRADIGARRRLRRSIALETIIGLLVVLAAGLLANVTPAIYEQPVWPFAPSIRGQLSPLSRPGRLEQTLCYGCRPGAHRSG